MSNSFDELCWLLKNLVWVYHNIHKTLTLFGFFWVIAEKKSLDVYRIDLSLNLLKIYHVFHVTLLRKYVSNPFHVLDFLVCKYQTFQMLKLSQPRISHFNSQWMDDQWDKWESEWSPMFQLYWKRWCSSNLAYY